MLYVPFGTFFFAVFQLATSEQQLATCNCNRFWPAKRVVAPAIMFVYMPAMVAVVSDAVAIVVVFFLDRCFTVF